MLLPAVIIVLSLNFEFFISLKLCFCVDFSNLASSPDLTNTNSEFFKMSDSLILILISQVYSSEIGTYNDTRKYNRYVRTRTYSRGNLDQHI